MLIKITRKEPNLLVALPRLIARLPQNYPRKDELNLSQQLYKIQAGFSGETKVDRYLELLELPKSSIVLTNVHLALSPGHSFQIDTLVLTKQFILLLEIKNMTGNLYFETDPHQLRSIKTNGEEVITECPITQLEVAKENLRIWLANQGINMDIDGQIILANRNSTVKVAPKNAPILYLKRLSLYLREKLQGPTKYNLAELKKMSEVIESNRLDYNPYPLCDYYNISPHLLKRGQLCSQCNSSMVYQNHKLQFCQNCQLSVLNNYREAIQDWFILINSTMSNRQCRSFLQLKNKDDAYYALKSINLNQKGKSVATKYSWPPDTPFETRK